MSYSLIVGRNNSLGDLLSFYRSLVMNSKFGSLVINSEFDLYGEFKCGYVPISYKRRNDGTDYRQWLLCQAVYKYDEIYNSHFFESISKEEFEATPKEFVTQEFNTVSNKTISDEITRGSIKNEDKIINVDEDKDHILLPHGDMKLIELESERSSPFVLQNFYKFKKTDLEPLYYSPDRMDSNPELVAAKDRFNASQFRNQLGINEDNRVGGNRIKKNKKRKTNKKRKQRMRKTKHKW
jgi:hypothetical protein